MLGIRPHDLELRPAEQGHMQARIELTEPLGATLLIHARSEHHTPFRILVPADVRAQRGDTISVEIITARAHVFDRETGQRFAGIA